MTPVTIIVPGKPLSVNAAKRAVVVHGRSMMLTSREARAWQKNAQAAAIGAMRGRGLLEGDLEFTIIAYWPRAGADSDAPLKPAKDALQGIVYANDRQVRRDHTDRQVDAANPRVEITVSVVGGCGYREGR